MQYAAVGEMGEESTHIPHTTYHIPSLSLPCYAERRAQELAPSFRARSEVAAYLVARAAPVHAAVTRVLRELREAVPERKAAAAAALAAAEGGGAGGAGAGAGAGGGGGLRPSSVLEYGARAGCGIWAVNQVRPQSTAITHV